MCCGSSHLVPVVCLFSRSYGTAARTRAREYARRCRPTRRQRFRKLRNVPVTVLATLNTGRKPPSPRLVRVFWRSLPDSCSRGRRSTLESAPIYITPRKKAPTWRCGALRPPVSPPFTTTPRSHRWSYACALTRSVSGIAWARPDQGSRSATRRASWAHCRSCMRRNTRQPREQDVRHASTKRRFAQARSASFDIFAVDCGAKR